MLTAEGCRQRRARLWASLNDKPDWILLHAPRHLVYFANFYASPFDFSSQNAGAALILGADGSSLLIADNLQGAFTSAAHVDEIASPLWYRSRESAPPRQQLLANTTLEQMTMRQGDRIGYEPEVPAAVLEGLRAARPHLEPVPIEAAILTLMRRKDADELAIMRQCMQAAEAGFAAGVRGIKPGMTELQAYALVTQAVMEAAGRQAIVYGDFASGLRTEQGGGTPSLRVIGKNNLVILDFSVVIQGYRGDFANTFVVEGGKPTSKQREMAEVCLEAMAVGEMFLKAGVVCREMDAAVRAVFSRHQMNAFFGHHVGHGLGLGHPDPPYIVPESSDTLLAGDVVTLEPGLYIKGEGGMRFERNYLITETGYETLTHHYIGLEPG